MKPITHPQLHALELQLHDLINRAEQLASKDPALLSTRVHPAAWSAVECLEHLNITARESLELVSDALSSTSSQDFSGTYRVRWLIRLFIRSLEPPVKLKTRTNRAFLPPATLNANDVLRAYLSLKTDLLTQLSQLEGYDLNTLRVQSPFIRRAHYSVYEWLLILLAHERRHVWQAEQRLAQATSGV